MRKIKKITIITLTYNNWRLLDSSISSVKGQKIDPDVEVEYLIVDDGTVDFDQNYINKKLENFPFHTKITINEENLGTVKSLNRAIQNSTGEIIIPLPADDEFYDDSVVNKIIKEFNKTQELIITGLRVPIKDNMELRCLPLVEDRHFFSSKSSLLYRIASKGNIISGASTYYHKDVFEKIGFFDTTYRLLEDYPFYIKALSNNINIHFFNVKTIKYGMEGVTSVGSNNLILKNDYINCQHYIVSLNILSFFGNRLIIYKNILSKKDKIKFINLLKYPELFIYFCFLRAKSVIKNKLSASVDRSSFT